jgi:hypothetical protein
MQYAIKAMPSYAPGAAGQVSPPACLPPGVPIEPQVFHPGCQIRRMRCFGLRVSAGLRGGSMRTSMSHGAPRDDRPLLPTGLSVRRALGRSDHAAGSGVRRAAGSVRGVVMDDTPDISQLKAPFPYFVWKRQTREKWRPMNNEHATHAADTVIGVDEALRSLDEREIDDCAYIDFTKAVMTNGDSPTDGRGHSEAMGPART